MKTALTHIDLFSGIGGFIEAAKQVGFTTIMGCEIEDDCRRYLERKYRIPVTDDIKEFDFTAYRGAVTLITGGPPCQPASLAGQRKGARDHRWLWPEAIRAVAEVGPDWFVFENPPGIKSLGLDGILAQLEACAPGYETTVLDIPACAVNAPHLRHRIWIVGNERDSNTEHGELYGHAAGENSGKQSEPTELSGVEGCGNTDNLGEQQSPVSRECVWTRAEDNVENNRNPLRIGRGTERDMSGRSPRTEYDGCAAANEVEGISNLDGQQHIYVNKKLQLTRDAEIPSHIANDGDANLARLERFSGNDAEHRQRAQPSRYATTTAYDNFSLIQRWTGREWVVSRVLRGFGGLDDGPRSRRILETMGNSVVVPVVVEILKAIKAAVEGQNNISAPY